MVVRVPASPAQALRTGLDVETWLAEGLVDILIPNPGYQPFSSDYQQFIDMGHRYGVPVYPCFNCSLLSHLIRKGEDQQCAATMLRSIASNFWAIDADGVYLFNFFVPAVADKEGKWDSDQAHSWLNEIGSPETLRGLDKSYRTAHQTEVASIGYGNAPGPLPARLVDCVPVPLVAGDDVQEAAEAGIVNEMVLRIRVSNVDAAEGITITINGEPVSQSEITRADSRLFTAQVSAPPLQQGVNEILILPGRGSIGRLSSTVTDMELSVRYKHK